MDTPNGSRQGTGLVLILGSRLTLAQGLHWPVSRFIVDGTAYTETGLGEWTGFYDWLRDKGDVLIGVRYWPSEPNEALVRAVDTAPYLQIGDMGELKIYFGSDRLHDPQRSNDQEFLYDAVFMSDDGTYAIVFDTTALHKKDLDHLAALPRHIWADIQAS